MNKIDRKAWCEKNLRLNKDVELKRGMVVRDVDGHLGVVVEIEPATEDFHGRVAVWQCDRTGYGDDNCEHYCFNNWQEFLRIS